MQKIYVGATMHCLQKVFDKFCILCLKPNLVTGFLHCLLYEDLSDCICIGFSRLYLWLTHVHLREVGCKICLCITIVVFLCDILIILGICYSPRSQLLCCLWLAGTLSG